MSREKFKNRLQAAYRLSEDLKSYELKNPLVLGIPRGAVPMARIIAENLSSELDVILVHKFTSPTNSENALGSVTEEGSVFLSDQTFGVSEKEIDALAKDEVKRLRDRRKLYTPFKTSVSPSQREVVVVDDGIETGATAIAAVRSLQSKGASRIIIAAAVAPKEAIEKIRAEGAEVCVLLESEKSKSVSEFFEDFNEVSDETVVDELSDDPRFETARKENAREVMNIRFGAESRSFSVAVSLAVPRAAHGLVIFAQHKIDTRTLAIAEELGHAGFGTLLFDLQDEIASNLVSRLEGVVRWAFADLRLKHLTIGLLGVNVGEEVLLAAANLPHAVACVVLQGGNANQELNKIELIKAPVLFVVGSEDHDLIEHYKLAMMQLTGKRVMSVVSGAGANFDEPAALDQVGDLAKDWFNRHLHGLKTKARLIKPAPKKKPLRRRNSEPSV